MTGETGNLMAAAAAEREEPLLLQARFRGELPVEREEGPLARVVVPLPEGEGYLLLRFEDTPVRRLGKAITVGTLTLLSGMIVLRRFAKF